MEKRLETVSVMQDILRDASTGLWCIELDPEKPPRLYADSTFREMMAMDASLTPEEGYRFWLDRVAPEDLPRVQASVEDMTRFLHAEALYAWNHPQRGTVYGVCSDHGPVRVGKPVHRADSQIPGWNRRVFRRVFLVHSSYPGYAV